MLDGQVLQGNCSEQLVIRVNSVLFVMCKIEYNIGSYKPKK